VELPDTYTVRTPTGGAHLYYSYPKDLDLGNRQGVFPGVDIRADGGFVVGEGSPHVNGSRYEYVGGEIATAPNWLIQAAKKAEIDPTDVPTPLTSDDPKFEDYVRRAADELRTYPAAVQGDCGGTQMFKACQIPVRKYQLPLDVAERLILEIYNPRCEPPWMGSELPQITYKIRQASEKGTHPIGVHDWIDQLIKREPPTVRKTPKADHLYTFDIGTPPSPQRVPICFSDVANVLLTDPEWEGVWQYDTFRGRVLAVDPPMDLDAEVKGLTESDGAKVLNWFEARGKKTSVATCLSACDLAAHRNKFHPVRDYLDCLPKTETSHLDNLASLALGNTDALAQKFVRLSMIAAVRRVLDPGCQVDDMLVLYGEQGTGKTSFCRILFGAWYRSQMPDLASKDASAALKGYWGVELAELDRVLRTENSTVKEFLSRTHDDYRPAYGRGEVHEPRQNVFIGTTNQEEFLRDETGERRYLPVQVGNIDLAWLKAHRDEIWSEALALAKSGVPHYLSQDDIPQANAAREAYKVVDPWEAEVLAHLRGKKWVRSTEDIATTRLGLRIGDISKRERDRIGAVLRKAGCFKKKVWHENAPITVWIVPQELAEQSAQPTPAEHVMNAVRNLSQN
jgi:predicted P-loop ATPase